MKMRSNGVFFAFLLIALAFTGCGDGGGPAATDTSADQLLASQLVGTWKLSQATKNGVLVPVLPTDSGEIGTISFNADRTATGSDYTITTSSGATVVDPNNPTPPPSTDFLKLQLSLPPALSIPGPFPMVLLSCRRQRAKPLPTVSKSKTENSIKPCPMAKYRSGSESELLIGVKL